MSYGKGGGGYRGEEGLGRRTIKGSATMDRRQGDDAYRGSGGGGGRGRGSSGLTPAQPRGRGQQGGLETPLPSPCL